MDARIAIAPGIVIDRRWALAGNVLNQSTAQRYVQDLNAATDGEHREPAAVRFDDQRDLTLVAPLVHFDRRMCRLAIPRRIHIFAARHDETSDSLEHGVSGRRGERGHNEGNESDMLEGFGIGRVHSHAGYAANELSRGRDGNKWRPRCNGHVVKSVL